MSQRINPYTRLKDDVAQFVARIWHRPKTSLFTVDVSDWARGQMDAAERLGYSLVLTRNGTALTVHAVKKINVYDVPYEVRPHHIEGAL